MTRRRVAILGSTGSIGTQALAVVAAHPNRFELVGLAAGQNHDLLREQALKFGVRRLSLASDGAAAGLRASLDPSYTVFFGAQGLHEIAVKSKADILLVATDGAVAFEAAFAAVAAGIDLAVANKELIVSAGELLLAEARRYGVQILPVDSEHSALFQCLHGEDPMSVERLILTASGGPFRTWSGAQIAEATVADALAHPTWAMGMKNSIDSATLMNKGLEVIEASKLFGIGPDRIDVVIHPTSLVHALVVFTDGNVKAQLSPPDMRLPIGYALAYPDRLREPGAAERTDALAWFGAAGAAKIELPFSRVDHARFPALGLAYRTLEALGTAPCTLSAANEVAVKAFYDGKIRFTEIARIVAATLDALPAQELTRAALPAADLAAREFAASYVEHKTAFRKDTV